MFTQTGTLKISSKGGSVALHDGSLYLRSSQHLLLPCFLWPACLSGALHRKSYRACRACAGWHPGSTGTHALTSLVPVKHHFFFFSFAMPLRYSWLFQAHWLCCILFDLGWRPWPKGGIPVNSFARRASVVLSVSYAGWAGWSRSRGILLCCCDVLFNRCFGNSTLGYLLTFRIKVTVYYHSMIRHLFTGWAIWLAPFCVEPSFSASHLDRTKPAKPWHGWGLKQQPKQLRLLRQPLRLK